MKPCSVSTGSENRERRKKKHTDARAKCLAFLSNKQPFVFHLESVLFKKQNA